ncbi:MAG: GNAT superfamily N-acetyltransferase [Oceanicoccus sp.]|jgi:GNAT superfamily N-acetyltransferase
MHIDSANLNNLTQLWQRYGARPLYEGDELKLRKNISWPNRVWADMAKPVSERGLEQAAQLASNTVLFPLWPAMTEDGSAAPQATVDTLVQQSGDWHQAAQHTAMALQLDKPLWANAQTVAPYPIQFKRVSGNADVLAWVVTGSKAFGYTIDENVIVPLLDRDDTQIFLAYNENSQPVATGLLFKTGDVVGIHQIGVPSDHQGKSYATQMMRFLIQCAEKWQANYVVLQASEAGRPVYQKLGFIDLFLITYLQRYKN